MDHAVAVANIRFLVSLRLDSIVTLFLLAWLAFKTKARRLTLLASAATHFDAAILKGSV